MQQLHLQTANFSFCCELLGPVSHAASHSNELCLLLNPLHVTFKYPSIWVSNNCKRYSSYCRLYPEHLDKWCGMFPFHFAYWLKVVDKWSFPSSDVFKEGLTLLITVSPRNWQISILHYSHSSVNHFGTRGAQTVQKPRLSWMISWAEAWPICRWAATASMVTHLITRSVSLVCSILLAALHMEGGPLIFVHDTWMTTFQLTRQITGILMKQNIVSTLCWQSKMDGYFSSNSCSTCFGQPCPHHQELMTAWCYSLVLVCAVTMCGVTQTCLTVSGLCVDMRVFWCWFHCCM